MAPKYEQPRADGDGDMNRGPDRALVARRLFEARTGAGLSRVQAAARIGIADNSLYRYEKARNLPRPEILAAMARVYGRPVEWFWGEAPPPGSSNWPAPSDPSGDGDVELVPVPVIATVAGSGAFTFDETVRYWLPFRQDFLAPNGMRARDCRMVEFRGDSMAPGIGPGSFVMVDTSRRQLQDGKVYLMTVPNEGVVVRRVFRAGTSWIVTADKPGSRPLVWDEGWTVHGLVCWTHGVCA